MNRGRFHMFFKQPFLRLFVQKRLTFVLNCVPQNLKWKTDISGFSDIFPERRISAVFPLSASFFFVDWWNNRISMQMHSWCRRLSQLPLSTFFNHSVLMESKLRHLQGQFHQHFTSSFYTHRSQKREKDIQVKQLFALLGSVCVKTACKHVVEIDPRSRFHQPMGAKYKCTFPESLSQSVLPT